MDRPELADFLRRRREQLVPSDVGLPPGVRRRTPGLRRDEVASLAGMSTDYYTRLEQARGPHPSLQVLGALARALRLTDDERDHLYFLVGYSAPVRGAGDKHIGPGMLNILAKLDDVPAAVVSDLSEILVQNPMHVVLFGDARAYGGLERYHFWRYFMNPGGRGMLPQEDWDYLSRRNVADLRATSARRSGDEDVVELVGSLRSASAEFESLWTEHEVSVRVSDVKRIQHREVGLVEVICEKLLTPNAAQQLLVYSPRPGTDARDKLDLLRVVGTQSMSVTLE
ncbi:helix-turn-helix domain-containing protein [Antrihabitans sp. YC3-6]|uniref:Helix-turn-helix domain-containing protein n=1 Tax=Antrihabitans stalagmiti TaxID=2799499 RepID=A0A934U2K7_9NOCA|nr:helix-turn-helix transcriptional regulator [Antrihabitans stalagmiti]MBJ8338867.1 helix-turn-helix domain-containing protein [Antrihabitans stalagmiti]